MDVDTSIFADDGVAAFVRSSAAFADQGVVATRAALEERAATRARGPELAEVTDLDTPGGPARLYRPTDDARALVLYLHGGGWSVGSIATYDRVSRRLAATSGAAVLTLAYRLAPEHPWPASVDDAVAALRWIASRPAALGAAADAVAVAGDSAGGALAALACLRLRDEEPSALPRLQVLVYANTDLAGDWPSMSEKGTGFGLEASSVRFFNGQWVPERSRWSDPGVSPLRADPAGLPEAVVVTAEHDPLRDEGEAYAARLAAAGVPVTVRREPGLVHNFLQLDEVSPAAAAAADRLATDIGTRLAPR